jgi:hypothetical protein
MLLYTNRDIVVDRFLNEISHNLGEKREREREVS